MTALKRGSVVLVPFPFTDLSAVKRRPSLVLSTDQYNATTGDAIIAQITSRVGSQPRTGDYLVTDWRVAGLLAPSLVRARMTTLHSSIVIRVMGMMPPQEMTSINRAIASALGLA